jgi:hypothetical protein
MKNLDYLVKIKYATIILFYYNMIPKIIHNIWLQGYDNLSNTVKIQHNNIKKINPDWEFIIWDNNMIEKLLKKYPKIYSKYKNTASYGNNVNPIKSDIARYVIMKEYGGLYCDIEYNCDNSFNMLFEEDAEEETVLDKKNTLYVASEENGFLYYIIPFKQTKYSSCFMAMNKQHPIWKTVLEKLMFAVSQEQIKMAFDSSLQEMEISNNKYPIIIFDKVNGHYQCKTNNTICYMNDNSSSNLFRTILKYINCYYKQIFLFILTILIILFVEKLYTFNAIKFGAVNFIPGMPPPNFVQQQNSVLHTSSKRKKSKSNK